MKQTSVPSHGSVSALTRALSFLKASPLSSFAGNFSEFAKGLRAGGFVSPLWPAITRSYKHRK